MATTTIKNTNIEGHVLNVPASMTRFGGWLPLANLTDMFTSLAGNPFEDSQKLYKGEVANLAPPQPLHCLNVERLEVHPVKPIAQRMSQLKEPVSSAVDNSFVRLAQAMLCLAAILAAFLFTSQFSVVLGNFGHASLKELRTFDSSAVTASEECFESEVKPCRVNGTSGLTINIFLLAVEHYPKTIHAVSLERASFDLAFDLASFIELVDMLAKADSISAEVRPASLFERDAAVPCRLFEVWLATLQSSSGFDPLEKGLVCQVELLDDCLNTLRADNQPVFAAIAKLGNVPHQGKFVAMLFEEPEVGFLKSYAMIPDTSSHCHYPVEPVALVGFVHSEFVAYSHASCLSGFRCTSLCGTGSNI